jgi:hypothetical protein
MVINIVFFIYHVKEASFRLPATAPLVRPVGAVEDALDVSTNFFDFKSCQHQHNLLTSCD